MLTWGPALCQVEQTLSLGVNASWPLALHSTQRTTHQGEAHREPVD